VFDKQGIHDKDHQGKKLFPENHNLKHIIQQGRHGQGLHPGFQPDLPFSFPRFLGLRPWPKAQGFNKGKPSQIRDALHKGILLTFLLNYRNFCRFITLSKTQ